MANQDRDKLCKQLQVFVHEDGRPVDSCCHLQGQCLAALPGSENLGSSS
jgi:hypothetical protein